MDERRKFVRLDINVKVNWQKISGQTSLNTDQTKNISAGGICIMVEEKLERGDLLKLEIELPSKKIIDAQGKVAWVNEFEIRGEKYEKWYDAGVEFLEINPEERKEIDKFIFSFLQAKIK